MRSLFNALRAMCGPGSSRCVPDVEQAGTATTLFVIVGGALAFAAIAVFPRFRLVRVTALTAALIVLVWISVRLAIIGYVSWMQPATLVGGVLILILASRLPSHGHL